MVVAPLLSALHVLALGIGLGSVFMRGRYLRALRAGPDPRLLARLFAADSLWGVAALLWLVTGLARAFGRVEKESGFYLRNGLFWVKMALFVATVALEIWPMTTFIRLAERAPQGAAAAGVRPGLRPRPRGRRADGAGHPHPVRRRGDGPRALALLKRLRGE